MAKTKIGNANEFEDGFKKAITLDWKSILIIKKGGRVYALDGRCSHMGVPLEKGTIVDDTIRCIAHGAVFDLTTGKQLQDMQARDIRSYEVTQEGDELFIDL